LSSMAGWGGLHVVLPICWVSSKAAWESPAFWGLSEKSGMEPESVH